jgi:capsular polysaccharide biosynthesis protein
MFVNRLKETNATGDLQSTIARVIDPATVPSGPFAPDKKQIVTIAAVATLIVAALLALLLDRLTNALNSTSDVEGRLGVPALGVLQKIKAFPRRASSPSWLSSTIRNRHSRKPFELYGQAC